MKMHIAVNGWFIGQQTTGSGQYLHHLLEHLPRQRAEVQISVVVPTDKIDDMGQFSKWLNRLNQVAITPVSVPPLPSNFRKLWWEQLSFPRAVRRLDADLAWVPYWAAPYWQPVPIVVTVHDVIPLLLPAYRGGIQHRLYTRLVTATARRSAAILTVSHASARDIIQQFGISPDLVHVVYHGPNSETASPLEAAFLDRIRNKYRLPEQFFLYLGGFDVRKNVPRVIEAYSRYLAKGGSAAIKLVIAGSLPRSASPFIDDPRVAVEMYQLDQHVYFPGWIEEDDKPALYALATAFVFPSLYEGFGMMALEAMAVGTPVITSAK